ncbi:hypothetical protein GCM10010387_15950 [Streptomyces inusitatus]|uniref:Uncharacterized protein n=1 Tax=Streptomyces inusitatus TaxID=68221 RepID=A0A918PUU4_9ACTN|nr:hypothetical protein [Streptomyces inusitatus]GGZ23565.1 hypothetical protein GCM10010387_15950 [Streptomyces inusitatus]
MYDVTIEHPAIEERTFFASGPGPLRDIVWGVARAQGEPVTDHLAMIAEVGALRSRADIEGEGELKIGEITVRVRNAEGCEGHQGEDAVLLGGPEFCDGSCRPRKLFKRGALLDLADALEDADLEASGGCSGCGLGAGQSCAGCGKCNCDRHDGCVRPKSQ